MATNKEKKVVVYDGPAEGRWITPTKLTRNVILDELSLVAKNNKAIFVPETHIEKVNKILKPHEAK
jgi:hypothetical protein